MWALPVALRRGEALAVRLALRRRLPAALHGAAALSHRGERGQALGAEGYCPQAGEGYCL